jgi:hypothetical protein
MEVGKADLVSHCFLMNSRLKVTVEPMSSEHRFKVAGGKFSFQHHKK